MLFFWLFGLPNREAIKLPLPPAAFPVSLETGPLVFTILVWEVKWGTDLPYPLSWASGLAGCSFHASKSWSHNSGLLLCFWKPPDQACPLTAGHSPVSVSLWTHGSWASSCLKSVPKLSFSSSVMSVPPSLAQPPSDHCVGRNHRPTPSLNPGCVLCANSPP